MYGWRARIGLVVPTNNTVIEPEFNRMAPDGVSVHAARILSSGIAPEAILKMVEHSHRAVDELHVGEMSVIAYACLATSLVKGPQWSGDFQASVTRNTGMPAITAATATIEALGALGVSRIALATPYPESINRILPGLFGSVGIQITALRNVAVRNSLETCRLPPQVAYRLAREADSAEAQAVCILATDFRTIDVLEMLERDLKKPVVSTNQALLWRALQLCRIGGGVDGFGSLLRAPATTKGPGAT